MRGSEGGKWSDGGAGRAGSHYAAASAEAAAVVIIGWEASEEANVQSVTGYTAVEEEEETKRTTE